MTAEQLDMDRQREAAIDKRLKAKQLLQQQQHQRGKSNSSPFAFLSTNYSTNYDTDEREDEYLDEDGNDSDTPLNLLVPKLKSAHLEVSQSAIAARALFNTLSGSVPAASHKRNDNTDPSSRHESTTTTTNPSSDNEAIHVQRQHPMEYQYESCVLSRFPDADATGEGGLERENFPENIHMFCFPNSLSFIYSPDSPNPPPSTCHSFVTIASEGLAEKNYGVCLTIYEKLREPYLSQLEDLVDAWRAENVGAEEMEYLQYLRSQLAVNQECILRGRAERRNGGDGDGGVEADEVLADAEEKVGLFEGLIKEMERIVPVDFDGVYVPRCIGVVGRWPFFDLFADWVKEVVRVMQGGYLLGDSGDAGWNVPLERMLQNFLFEIPLPPPGRVEVKISVGKHSLFCSRPPVNSIQVLQNFSLYPLFRTLSVTHIITLFEHALTEKRILFLSKHYSMLTLACESLVLLLYPFTWQHHYIPILPVEGIKILQATMPFMVGVHKDYFGKSEELEADWKNEICIVDLDTNTLTTNCDTPSLPPRDRRKLIARLLKYTGARVVSPNPSSASRSGGAGQTAVVYEVPPRGVPFTTREAFPLGRFVPRSAVSRRWLAQVEAESEVGDEGGGGIDAEEEEEVVVMGSGRRGSGSGALAWLSKESVSSSVHSEPAVVAGQVYLNAVGSAKQGLSRGSMENLKMSMAKFRFGGGGGLPGQIRTKSLGVSRSAAMQQGEGDEFEDDLDSVDGGSHGSGGSLFQALQSIHTDPSSKSRRVPVNYTPSLTSSMTTAAAAPSTSYDNSSLKSPTSLLTSDSRQLQPKRRSQRSQQHQHGPVTMAEGHAFYAIRVDGAGEEGCCGSPRSSEDQGSCSNGGGSESGVSEVMSVRTQQPQQVPLSSEEKRRSERGSLLNTLARTSRSIASLSTLGGVGANGGPPNKRTSLNLSGKDGEADHGATAAGSPGAAGKASGNSPILMSWKGDSNSKPEESMVCRLCWESLKEGGEGVALKCQYCKSTIHTACLPLVEGSPCITFFNEKKIQYSFFKVFTSLLKTYRTFLVMPEKLKLAKEEEARNGGITGGGHGGGGANIVGLDLMPDDWFRKAEFLASVDRETRAYLTHIVETQNFVQFTLERVELPESDYEILFFDESVKAKLNRSKIKFTKETTPFLKDGAYSIRATITALAPNSEGLEKDKSFSSPLFPLTIDPHLLTTPRKVNPLVTEADQNMMRSHTNEIVNRTHIASTKRKQDFSKWMRVKLKHIQRPESRLNNIDLLTEEEREMLFEDKLNCVGGVISTYEGAHLASQSNAELQAAIEELHGQQYLLIDMTEAQLVDAHNQDAYKSITNRLLNVMTLYKEHLFALENPEYAPRTPAGSVRRPPPGLGSTGGGNSKTASPDQMSIASAAGSAAATVPVSVRSRSESLRKPQTPAGQGASPSSSVRGIRALSTAQNPERKPSLQTQVEKSEPALPVKAAESELHAPSTPQIRSRTDSIQQYPNPIHRSHSTKSKLSSHVASPPPRSPTRSQQPPVPTSQESIDSQKSSSLSSAHSTKGMASPKSSLCSTPPQVVLPRDENITSSINLGESMPRSRSFAQSIDLMMKSAASDASINSGRIVDDAISEIEKAQDELRLLVEATRKRIPELVMGDEVAVLVDKREPPPASPVLSPRIYGRDSKE
ncbi:hypothetical protein HDU98_007115 [Podochytrium sp. JEL0797]|nr:hypothetical protein HDU98_007115 [Podochytrium sp. JEL0797]